MEWKWKRNGKGKENKIEIDWSENLLEWNGIGMEMERNFPKKKVYAKKEWKWNGNRMVMEWKINGRS